MKRERSCSFVIVYIKQRYSNTALSSNLKQLLAVLTHQNVYCSDNESDKSDTSDSDFEPEKEVRIA